jgi:hypothetical protein
MMSLESLLHLVTEALIKTLTSTKQTSNSGVLSSFSWFDEVPDFVQVPIVPVHGHFPHTYTSEIRHVSRSYLWL